MSIRLGTSILQVYTRHPYTTAQQALTIHDVAPGRLRLGMGVSHPHIMVDQLGLSLNRPISYLREYVSIVRALLWEGHVNHIGRHFSVQAALRRTARVPLLAAALGSGSFRLAGQVADGAISWMCPPSYLRAKALRSLGEGADLAGRPRPPLVAHMLVSLNTDHAAAHAAAKRTVEYYGKARFYLNMFRQAGYPIDEDPKCVDELADSLLISGTQETVREKILELLGVFDELLLTQLVTQGADQEWVELSRLVGSL
jgi:alkanesulfonate monooxygenase SsuD/methylene tetrahydromethanopterin reductase-like flavin-dependent oxidoreductase (luciferase family)